MDAAAGSVTVAADAMATESRPATARATVRGRLVVSESSVLAPPASLSRDASQIPRPPRETCPSRPVLVVQDSSRIRRACFDRNPRRNPGRGLSDPGAASVSRLPGKEIPDRAHTVDVAAGATDEIGGKPGVRMRKGMSAPVNDHQHDFPPCRQPPARLDPRAVPGVAIRVLLDLRFLGAAEEVLEVRRGMRVSDSVFASP
jgi:hypothetical protein